MYDIAIIGAGINGCSLAYELKQENKNVVLFDKDGIASGGSGAAGAFISPKFSKSGELKELLHDAFVYSLDFYEKNFPKFLTKAQLLHIAKDEAEEKALRVYKKHTTLELLTPSNEILSSLTTESKTKESVSINAGVVDASSICKAMSENVDFIKESVNVLVYDNGSWIINDTYMAKEVILATGAYKSIIKEPYIQLRGVWGHRIDVKTTTKNKNSIHQFVSISPSDNGKLAIGATHNVHYHPETSDEPYDINSGRKELLEKASRTINLENLEVIQDYMGLRSGSFDYMPIIGSLVLSDETLKCCEKNIRVKKPDFNKFVYYPNLYMINGSGGYGFVLAPYLARMLKEHIVASKPISDRLSPARFFARWAKKT